MLSLFKGRGEAGSPKNDQFVRLSTRDQKLPVAFSKRAFTRNGSLMSNSSILMCGATVNYVFLFFPDCPGSLTGLLFSHIFLFLSEESLPPLRVTLIHFALSSY